MHTFDHVAGPVLTAAGATGVAVALLAQTAPLDKLAEIAPLTAVGPLAPAA